MFASRFASSSSIPPVVVRDGRVPLHVHGELAAETHGACALGKAPQDADGKPLDGLDKLVECVSGRDEDDGESFRIGRAADPGARRAAREADDVVTLYASDDPDAVIAVETALIQTFKDSEKCDNDN